MRFLLPKDRGVFIVFEGLDGSGQTTQVNLLGEFLGNKGHKVVKTKEPTTKSQAGKRIQNILNEKERVSPKELQELFAEDRKEHLKNEITPSINQGKIVICDRYLFSSLCYGKASGVDIGFLKEINQGFLMPDIVFFLDVQPSICIERIKKRGEGEKLFEKERFLELVYQNYKEVLSEFKNLSHIFFIDGEKEIKDVFEQIKSCFLF